MTGVCPAENQGHVGDNFPYSRDIHVCLGCDILRRNQIPSVTV